MRYAIVIEKGPTSYGAYVPDLPGCVAVAKTVAEVKKLIAEAVPLHLDGLREDGLPIPDPQIEYEYVEFDFSGRVCPACKGTGLDKTLHRRYTSGGPDDRRCKRCNGECYIA